MDTPLNLGKYIGLASLCHGVMRKEEKKVHSLAWLDSTFG
jgi:hypothetical protein